MKRMVEDVMTRDVVTVDDSTPYKDVVRIIKTSDVSAVPVADDAGHLVGVISEADLLLKQEHRPGDRHHVGMRKVRREREKAAGTIAGQIMSAPVVSVRPDAPVGEAARLMHRHGVKRLPVVDAAGKVVGIVSRRDLLTIFMRPDDEIRHDVIHDVIERKLWLTPEEAHLHVSVADGVVHLDGRLDRKSVVEILVGLVFGVEGVVDVDNRLTYERDDSRIQLPASDAWGVLPYGLRRP